MYANLWLYILLCGFVNKSSMADELSRVQSTANVGSAENSDELPDKRERKRTEKGQEEYLRLLKKNQTSAISAVSKKRSILTDLMGDENNLHLVKSELILLNTLFNQYQEAYERHYQELSSEDEQFTESSRHEAKENSVLEFRRQVIDWISLVEQRLTDQLDHLSDKGSVSSKSSKGTSQSKSSRTSAREKEKVRVAELLAEKTMLERKQALRAADEALRLETEIVKAKARERVYADLELEENPGNVESKDATNTLSERIQPKTSTPNAPVSKLDPITPKAVVPKPDPITPKAVVPKPDPITPKAVVPKLDPLTPEFHPSGSIAKYRPPDNSTTSDLNAPSTSEIQDRSFQEVLIATHQQLAAAMTLPQPEVSNFKGDPIEYQTFIMAFTTRIESKTVSAADRLYYLIQHLDGEPKELISGTLHMNPSEGYKEARRLLAKEYGDPFKVSMAYVSKALRWSPIQRDDALTLKRFSFFLTKCKNAMMNVSHMTELNHPTNMQTIARKLPPHLQSRWRDRVVKLKEKGRIADFKDIAEFVESAAESANDPIYGSQALNKSEQKHKASSIRDSTKRTQLPNQRSSSFATNVNTPPASVSLRNTKCCDSNTGSCLLCNKPHDLDDCDDFRKRTIEEKRSFLGDRKLCYACYGTNHVSRNCLKKRTCQKCGKRHPTALHMDDFKPNKKDGNSETDNSNVKPTTVVENGCVDISETVCNATINKETVVLHAILPIKIRKKGNAESVTTYAFYDGGSSGCFVTENIRRLIGEEGVETVLQLGTMHGHSRVETTVLADLVVTDLDDNNPIELPRTFTSDEIPAGHHQIPTPELLSRWEHLSEVAQKIPAHRPDLEIGLLIGSNCPVALEPLDVIPSHGDGPFALRLHHGWTVSGPLQVETDQSCSTITVNRITVREVEFNKEIIAPKSLLSMFEMDFNDHTVSKVPDERGYSQEDRKFLDMAEKGVRNVNGHYEIPLPFRAQDITMPNNKEQAIKRANWQKKKMLRDAKYHTDYTKFVNDVIAKGYAQKVPNESGAGRPGKVWYLPHHGIYHPKKPDRIRVVFDCSASFNGVSLNDQLLQGPDLTNSLVGVLIRFREDPVAFLGDVEAMFHQVRVPPEQCDFLRFLWWPNGDLDAPLEEYRMVVHLFGAVSSPSIANFALKKTASDNEKEYGTIVANTLRKNFYVDDCLRSVDTENTAGKLIKDLSRACQKGGFHLTKFTCNRRGVLEQIPEEERSKETKALDLHRDNLPIERALGVQWCVQSDSFGFRIILNNKPITRRGILSTVSSIYDPLGFIAPFTLVAKQILQELCRSKSLGWDDEEYRNQWIKWQNELPTLELFHVDRCLKPREFGPIVSRQLHLFSDASTVGYGCSGYLRLQDDANRIHCAFLMGKARLAPIKTVTVPRLELTAATVSVRVGQMLIEELETKPDVTFYHTDSTTVLRYIGNEQKRFQVFVSNRVQLIRDFTSPHQWRYVDTLNNPADDASRGMKETPHLQHSRWIKGPEFLWKPVSEWPQQPFLIGEIPEDDPEIKKVVVAGTVVTEDSTTSVNKLIEYHSDWHRLKLSVAVFLRIKATLLRRRQDPKKTEVTQADLVAMQRPESVKQRKAETKHVDHCNVPLSVQELNEAEIAIIQFLQSQVFSKELDILHRANNDGEPDSRGQEKQKKVELRRLVPCTV